MCTYIHLCSSDVYLVSSVNVVEKESFVVFCLTFFSTFITTANKQQRVKIGFILSVRLMMLCCSVVQAYLRLCLTRKSKQGALLSDPICAKHVYFYFILKRRPRYETKEWKSREKILHVLLELFAKVVIIENIDFSSKVWNSEKLPIFRRKYWSLWKLW